MQKITKEVYLDWYENMMLWRKFEDKLAAVYIQQKVRGFLHLYNCLLYTSDAADE